MSSDIKITEYRIAVNQRAPGMTIALLADIHGASGKNILSECRRIQPDVIAIAGDLVTNLGVAGMSEEVNRGFSFLTEAETIAPVFYSLGNHERGVTEENRKKICETGAVLLDNTAVYFHDIWIGGLSSGYQQSKQGHLKKTPPPDLCWLQEFSQYEGYKVLLSHHPEYYPEYIRETKVDLILSGHAHGGQWRFLGRGVFAPGQGLFPEYTSGVYDGRLVVSKGLSNTAGMIPRLFNPKEIVVLRFI